MTGPLASAQGTTGGHGGEIIVISSHVARGSVGARGSTQALEGMGFRVWSVPTILLPFHPGHGPSQRIVPDTKQFGGFLADLAGSRWVGKVSAILTGYMAEPHQAKAAAGFIGELRAGNPGLLHICDPVIGDMGKPYVAIETAAAIREALVPGADWITPNRFELEWLAGMEVKNVPDAIEALAMLGRDRALVTSLPGDTPGRMGNLLLSPGGSRFAEHEEISDPPKGPGDLLSALFCGHLLRTGDPQNAFDAATRGTISAIAAAVQAGDDELQAGSSTEAAAPVISARPISTSRSRPPASGPLVGVDGCRAGWIAVSGTRDDNGKWQDLQMDLLATPRELLATFPAPCIIAIDMPIGLPDSITGSGRGPEQAVRPLLGKRQSSVFSIPSRSAVEADDYGEACRLALATSNPPRKVSRQSFMLFEKIRQLDLALRETGRDSVYECHPELAFCMLNNGHPMQTPKKIGSGINSDGLKERRKCLMDAGFEATFLDREPPRGAAMDDLLDACACLAVAARIHDGQARAWPFPFDKDRFGLPVAIWA